MNKIKAIMRVHEMTIKEFRELIKMSDEAVRGWIRGNIPAPKSVDRIVEAFKESGLTKEIYHDDEKFSHYISRHEPFMTSSKEDDISELSNNEIDNNGNIHIDARNIIPVEYIALLSHMIHTEDGIRFRYHSLENLITFRDSDKPMEIIDESLKKHLIENCYFEEDDFSDRKKYYAKLILHYQKWMARDYL